jgi:hypothetical protein
MGHRFSLGVKHGDDPVGAAIVSRPVARQYDASTVAVVTSLVTDGTPHVASMLYAGVARACKALGFLCVQTYILSWEPGTSLRAAGWSFADTVTDSNWGKRGKRGKGQITT